MDRDPNRPLTPDEAKQRLRAATREFGVAPWVRRHPLSSLVMGATAGYLLNALPRGQYASSVRRLLPLVETLLRLFPLDGGQSGRGR